MVDEEKKHNANENIFLNALAIFGLWGWFGLFTGMTRGEWVNPWNVLPSWLMDTILIGFTVEQIVHGPPEYSKWENRN